MDFPVLFLKYAAKVSPRAKVDPVFLFTNQYHPIPMIGYISCENEAHAGKIIGFLPSDRYTLACNCRTDKSVYSRS